MFGVLKRGKKELKARETETIGKIESGGGKNVHLRL